MKAIKINRENGKITTETITAISAEIVNQFASNTAAKAAKKQIAEAYGLSDREAIECLKAANAVRLERVANAIATTKTQVFDFAKWLAAGFDILKSDKGFQGLFALAEARKATKEDLTDFCRKYYAAVSENGDFLKPQYLYRVEDGEISRIKVFTKFDGKNAADAVKVLKSSFEGFAKSLKFEATGKGAAFLNIKPINTAITMEIYDIDSKSFELVNQSENLNTSDFSLTKSEALAAIAPAAEK